MNFMEFGEEHGKKIVYNKTFLQRNLAVKERWPFNSGKYDGY